MACINGHLIEASDAAFCEECGAPLAAGSGATTPAVGGFGLGVAGRIGLAVLGVLAVGAGVGLYFAPAGGDNAQTKKAVSLSSAATGASRTASPTPGAASVEQPTSAAGAAAGAAGGTTNTAIAPAATATSVAAGGAAPTATSRPTTSAAAVPTSTPIPPTATPRPPTSTPVPPTSPPTATKTTAPTLVPNIRVYGTMTLGVAGGPCGGCEAALKGPKQIGFNAKNDGSYDTKALGFSLPPGSYKVYYTCNGQQVSTGQTVVLVGPDVQFDIKIGFCG